MPNPIKVVWDYYAKSGTRLDIPVMKRMFVEIPHIPYGIAVATASMTAAYIYLNYFFDTGIGFQTRYTVLRPDDPRIPKFKDRVINAEKYAQS